MSSIITPAAAGQARGSRIANLFRALGCSLFPAEVYIIAALAYCALC
jgi:hypothetical protein